MTTGRAADVKINSQDDPPTAWVATASEIESSRNLGILRSLDGDAPRDHILAARASDSVPVASCQLIYREGYAWLDGFTAPVGDPWRGFVTVLTAEALRRAAELELTLVRTDVRECGSASRELLGSHGFRMEPGSEYGDRNPIWSVAP